MTIDDCRLEVFDLKGFHAHTFLKFKYDILKIYLKNIFIYLYLCIYIEYIYKYNVRNENIFQLNVKYRLNIVKGHMLLDTRPDNITDLENKDGAYRGSKK